jgi:hypothetical protein
VSGAPGKAEAWAMFDRIVEQAAAENLATNPWRYDQSGQVYAPDYPTLQRLLAVPLLLGSTSQSGIPALALDVWTAYELRRAGFEPDRVWPRARPPRILPQTLTAVRKTATQRQRAVLDEIVASGKTYDGETGAGANILGKNYVKQVDVVISSWQTGPELMISTKRMDSSFGNNAANRVEESYGDAKNLRSRHPQAALGFVYSLSSTAFSPENRRVADWIVDLLGKLGREDDAYDAVALVVPDLATDPTTAAAEGDAIDGLAVDEQPLVVAGLEPTADDGARPLLLPSSELDRRLDDLPPIGLRHDVVPPALRPEAFFAAMVNRVLDNCPINFHEEARTRRATPGTGTP